MTKREEREGLGRRGFLGVFAGAATAATASTAIGTGAVTEARAQESDDEKRKARYQETEHVQDYYRTNRY